MIRPLLFMVLLALRLVAADSAANIAAQLHQVTLDPHECYRVIDLNYSKADARIYFTSGYLIFAKPVNGKRIGAAFSADVEGGDGEILILPPMRSERLSLANFIESPNLNEHFRSALLLFSDTTADELVSKLHAGSMNKPAPEMGALLADKFSTVLQNLAGSFEVRLVGDLLSSTHNHGGLFYLAVNGVKLGNFDVISDAASKAHMLVGQLAYRDNRTYFDIWTNFAAKPKTEGGEETRQPEISLDDFRIDTTIEPDLTLKATTRVIITPSRPIDRAIVFSISNRMRVLEAQVDGKPAEVFQRESLRSNLIQSLDNEQFLLVTATPLEPGKPHELVFRHEGAVISKAGNGVYFVGARGIWYPRRDQEFARYDLTFRYPKSLGLVATGEVVEDRTEGEFRVTRHQSANPIRFAGFNLGDYESAQLERGRYRIQVFANRKLEAALQPKPAMVPFNPPTPWTRSRRPVAETNQIVPPPPVALNPTARLHTLATNIANSFDFMVGEFGPPPARTLTVSPIPGGFGQGFPGLVYLSTIAYLDPSERPAGVSDRYQQTFFSDVLEAHEIAHQWWGNLVIPETYQDAWLMESLANYSALLYLEKKKSARALDAVLEDYKNHLLAKGPNGKPVESAGPITWGNRLVSSQSPGAWHVITYEKGTWVLHMLRKRLGDAQFEKMLRQLCEDYRFRALNTEQFRQVARKFMPPHMPDPDLTGFFDTWIYGTGVPAIKLTYAIRGAKLTGTVSQSGVDDDFATYIPLEVQNGRQRTLQWVATGSEPIPFSIPLHRPATKVALATNDALITQKKP